MFALVKKMNQLLFVACALFAVAAPLVAADDTTTSDGKICGVKKSCCLVASIVPAVVGGVALIMCCTGVLCFAKSKHGAPAGAPVDDADHGHCCCIFFIILFFVAVGVACYVVKKHQAETDEGFAEEDMLVDEDMLANTEAEMMTESITM